MNQFTLSYDQRQQAQTNARLRVAGIKPERDNAPVVHSYPRTTVNVIFGLTVIAMIAFFFMSASRIYHIAYHAYMQAIPIEAGAQFAGVVTILGAEAGQLIFMLASAVIPTSALHVWRVRVNAGKLSLWFGALICTAIALVGNWEVVRPRDMHGAFPYLEAIAPPLLFLIGAFVLKGHVLRGVRDNQAYEAQLTQWQSKHDNAHTHDSWRNALAHEYRNMLHATFFKRRKAFKALTDMQIRQLVIAELNADDWALDIVKEAAPALPRVSATGTRDGSVNGARIRPHDDGVVIECSECAWESKPKVNESSARAALTAHMAKHKARVNGHKVTA